MIEFIKQLFAFLAGITQYLNNKTLIDAGEKKQNLMQTEQVLDNVLEADKISIASDSRTVDFFLRHPESGDK